jgi:hypothetical protein
MIASEKFGMVSSGIAVAASRIWALINESVSAKDANFDFPMKGEWNRRMKFSNAFSKSPIT